MNLARHLSNAATDSSILKAPNDDPRNVVARKLERFIRTIKSESEGGSERSDNFLHGIFGYLKVFAVKMEMDINVYRTIFDARAASLADMPKGVVDFW